MSRSRRKHAIWARGSEKGDKRKNNRRLRKRCKDALQKGKEVMPIMREVSDPWDMTKDGKIDVRPGSSDYQKALRK